MDGVLVIDKPAGWTSHDVVAKVRNITRIRKVGHTGTLDPFATGVLALTLGRATRLTNYYISSDKVYRGVMRFGFATTTFDLDGEPAGEDTKPTLEEARLAEIFLRYQGTITQTIPPFSAKKIQGKPMYAYARKGVELEPATKTVTVRSLQLIRVQGAEAEFELKCSAGTYARGLAHDVGREYGCGAHLARLCRIQSGEFTLGNATTMRAGEEFHPKEHFLDRVIPLQNLLCDLPAIVVSAGDREKIRHGMDLDLLTSSPQSGEFRLLDEEGRFVALGKRLHAFVSPVAQPAHWVRIHPHIIFA